MVEMKQAQEIAAVQRADIKTGSDELNVFMAKYQESQQQLQRLATATRILRISGIRDSIVRNSERGIAYRHRTYRIFVH